MQRLAPLALLLAAVPAAAGDRQFRVPDGFEVVKVAGPPLVDRPIVADFDEQGRLYVADSSGSNENVQKQVKNPTHRIVRLEDTNGDGVFDKAVVFADKMMFPEGAMWLGGSLYVAAPPHIWKLTDTDGDGVADKREVWFDGKTLTGCANDLHGPYRGPDGYIYWCKGAFARQEYMLPTGKKFTTRAAHIFRAKPDGTGIEPVMTGGMDNPVDVVFTPGGERIFSTTFFQHPGDGRRDGLIHAIYGGVYGKLHDPVFEHPWTGPHLMPVLTHLGPAAPCGLHRYESDQFGPEYRDNLFCAQFNLRKVSRHVLVPKGSTFETRDSDFLTSEDRDFHPTDVIEDADGSLLVIDTGGWYKLCCPTSQLVKPDELGGIYRVRKKGSHKVDDPWGKKVDWDGDSGAQANRARQLFGDPRPAVRRTAIERTVSLAKDDSERTILQVKFIWLAQQDQPFAVQRAGIEALTRINAADARKEIRALFPNVFAGTLDEAGATLLAQAAGLWRDAEAVPQLRSYLKAPLPVRRAAAEALARIGDPAAIPDILAALADEQNDRPLDHSLTYALIEIGDRAATAAGLSHPSPRVKRAALAALDQMPGGRIDAKEVLPHLAAADSALRETAWWVAGHHSAWGEQLAGVLRAEFATADTLMPPARDDLVARAAKFAGNDAVRAVLGGLLEDRATTGPVARLVLRAMAEARPKALPAAWRAGLAAAVASDDVDTARAAFALLRAVPADEATAAELAAAVEKAGRLTTWPDELKLAYLATVPRPSAELTADALAFVTRKLARGEPPADRALAAEAVLRAKPTPAALTAVAAALKTAGPLEVVKLLPAFARSADEAVGLALVAAAADPAVRPAVRTELLKPVLDKYPEKVREAAAGLYAALDADKADQRAKLEAVFGAIQKGDVRRGELVFNGTKAACATCHTIGYVGGTVGPDLTKIGGIRTERDLLESILYPSASFVRSYEPVKVSTADGQEYSGILKKDAPDELVLVVAADKEVRVPRANVEEVRPGTVSVMPAGLDQQLSKQELADLIAFLKACR